MDAGRALWKQHTLQAALFSFPLALVAAAYLAVALRLSDGGWAQLIVLVGVLIGPCFALGIAWQRRAAGALLDWLAGSGDRDAGEILEEVVRLPLRLAFIGYATWIIGGSLVVSLAGGGVVEGFGLLDAAASLACTLAAGLVSSLFAYANWKRLSRDHQRRLVAEAGMQARCGAPRLLRLRTKLQLAFLATGTLPLLLAGFLVYGAVPTLGLPLVTVTLVAAGFAFVLARAVASEITATTEALTRSLERIASGELSEPAWIETDDELGQVARSCDRLVETLCDTVGGLTTTADAVDRATEELGDVARTVIAGSQSQSADVAKALDATASIETQANDIASQSDALSISVKESVSSISELSASSTGVRDFASGVASQIDTSVDAIEQIAERTRRIASVSERLAQSADEATSGMHEHEASTRSIDERARAAQVSASDVMKLCGEGRLAVASVGRGIESIQRSVADNERITAELTSQVEQIGTVVTVIDDVARETQLLALNAAIIAAQSGEQGRSFSIVATEVKGLAGRVTSRIREIEGIIEGIEDAARQAAVASETNRQSVAEGLQLSATASTVLEAIAGAAVESGEHMEAIGRATVEQAATARHLVEVVAGLDEQARQIDGDVAAQRESQEAILEMTDAVRGAAHSVQRSTEEQAQSLILLRNGANTVEDSCVVIQHAIQGQSADCESSVAVMRSLDEHAQGNAEAIDRFAGAIDALRQRGAALRERIGRFSTGEA